LLSTPLNVLILQALAGGPKQQMELRRAAGSPAQSTLRARLKRLAEVGAIEMHHRNRFPGVREYELTAVGRELTKVLDVLERWLDKAPDSPLALGGSAAKAAIGALAEGWSTTMLRVLAAGPHSLTELDSLIAPVSYPSLERRLAAMRLAGLVEPLSSNGHGTPYGITDWLRLGIAPLTSAARWEARNAGAQSAPVTRLDLETTFLLSVPLIRPTAEVSGLCRLAAEISSVGKQRQRLAGVVVEVREGAISSCVTGLEGRADAWALGSSAAWLDALVRRDTDRLEVGGDGHLAGALLDGLHRELFGQSGQAPLTQNS
jgi:DNA-binding HxlR family transcriptional regulator